MKKVLIISALAMLLLGAVIINKVMTKVDQNKKTAESEKVITVETENATSAYIEGSINYTGNVQGIHEATIISQTAGVVKKVNVSVGSRVGEGQVIAVVENTQQDAAVEQARAQVLAAESNYEKAKNDLARVERLAAESVATKDNLEMSQLNVKAALAQLKGAQAGLKSAEKMLGDTYIKSTISGYVGTRDVETGATVSPGARIAQIVDVSKFRINIMVSENDIVKLKPGKTVNVKVDALPAKVFDGKVNTIGMSSSNGLRSYPVEVTIDNKSNDIKSGMFARCEIISDTKNDALVVPEKSVIINNDGTTKVYVLDNGRAYARNVVLGIKAEGRYEIASGLNAGDKVITTGKERLTDGIKVREK